MVTKNQIVISVLIACYFFVVGSLYAQDVVVDSLILEMEQAGTAQNQIYRKITRYWFSIEAEVALEKCDAYLQKIKDKNSDLFLWMLGDKASLLTSLSRSEEAIDVMKILFAKAVRSGYYVQQVNYSQTLARKFIRINQPDSANYYLILAEKIANRHKLNANLWAIANTQSMLAGYLGNEQAKGESLEQSWRLMERYDSDSRQKGYMLYIVADFFYLQKNWEKYSFYNELLIEYFKAKKKDVPMSHMPITAHMVDEDPMNPILESIKVLKVADSLGKISTYVMTVLALDDAFANVGQIKKSLPFLLRAEQLVEGKNDFNGDRLVLNRLQSNYEEQGNYYKAYQYALKNKEMADSIFQKDKAESIAEMNAKYGLEKKERLITEQKLILEKQKLQRSYYQFGAVLFGLLALISFWYYRKRLVFQKTISDQKAKLHQQKIIELQQQKDLEVMNAMLNGQEQERGRVAKDLHDGLGGVLSSVKAHFQGIVQAFPVIQESGIYNKTLDLVTNAGDEVRRVAHDILPRALSLAGLQPALEDLAESLVLQGIDCKVEVFNLPKDCSASKEIMVYRIIQELTNNIVKHSHAKSVFIQLFAQQDLVNLTIEDDGDGFDVDLALQKDGMGLANIQSRVAFLQGKIIWDSVIGKGTTINIEIPII